MTTTIIPRPIPHTTCDPRAAEWNALYQSTPVDQWPNSTWPVDIGDSAVIHDPDTGLLWLYDETGDGTIITPAEADDYADRLARPYGELLPARWLTEDDPAYWDDYAYDPDPFAIRI